jgi:small subunit ribosomal protein S6
VRSYETLVIFDAQLEDEPIEQEISRVEQLIASHKGEIVNTERWGRRKLSYGMKRRQQGYYALIRFNAHEAVPQELDRVFKLNERVLRHLIALVRNHDLSDKLPGEAVEGAEAAEE